MFTTTEPLSKTIQDWVFPTSLNIKVVSNIDDKCYLRCGTSEGFLRPLHNPAQLIQDKLKHELPSYDYPKRTGYVSPGVVLMVNEQIETEHYGQDKFVPGDITVSVTC